MGEEGQKGHLEQEVRQEEEEGEVGGKKREEEEETFLLKNPLGRL